ncbi:MAG: carboxymuconolactone decarboxylase family protein [Gammaproteobacteria bacterium]
MVQPEPLLQRIPRVELPPDMQAVWDSATQVTGDATFIEVSGNDPDSFRWYLKSFYEERFYGSRLPRRILELVRLRLANLHGCAFCNKGDRAQALAAGMTEAELDSLPDYENGPFSERERAILSLTDHMALTNANGRLTAPLYARLHPHFSDSELYELGMIMAVLCGMAKFLFVFDLVEKEPGCPFG